MTRKVGEHVYVTLVSRIKLRHLPLSTRDFLQPQKKVQHNDVYTSFEVLK